MNQPMIRVVVFAVALLVAAPVQASPRNELLRVAPPDAAILFVVQNARDHVRNLTESPFGQWFPTTGIGKKLLDSTQLKQLRDSSAMIFGELGTTPRELIDEVLGDAVAFAYSPAPPDRPNDERAVILVRPRKPELLAKLVERMNEVQTKSGELKAVARKEHAGAAYFERQKPGSASEFYCFRGEVFAFSSSEADIKAVIDRDRATPTENTLVARMQKLGVADSAAVLLVNPRPLDAEVKAKVASAKPDEKRFLERFAEVWAGLDSAALYLNIDANLEIGVALRFQAEKLPADAKRWLTGVRAASPSESLIPKDALFGIAGHVSAVELIDLVASLAPVEKGKPGVKDWIAQTLGPMIGKDKLPVVLNSLGPNWAMWAEPPAKDALLPTLVAAIEIGGPPANRPKAEKTLVAAVGFGFRMAAFAYNMDHADQIEVVEDKDAKTGAVIVSLVNDKGFPPGFRPSFAAQHGYFVLATSPEAITRFAVPPPDAKPNDYATVARLSGTACRAYLVAHGPKLAKFLAGFGLGDEKQLTEHIDTIATVLELLDSADVTVRGDDSSLRIAVRVKPAKPLKK